MRFIIISLFIIINFYNVTFSEGFKTLSEKVYFYKNKFKVECVDEKITDNFGNGYDLLYGTRNMRTILYGIAYRGGANNFYHKSNKRDNHNPLPQDGLENLCQLGFDEAIYLYNKNFKDIGNYDYTTEDNQLHYSSNTLSNRKDIKELLLQVKSIIDNPDKGPIYLHCWNGWHQSGYASAAILMQFCKFTNDEALKYWYQNTDGVTKGYDKVINLVKNFKTFDDIKIDEATQKEICPCFKTK